MQLAMLKFETKLQMCIRMWITIFKIFIWGGISLDILSEIAFYGSLTRRRKTKFPTDLSDDILLQMSILNTVIP